MKLATVEIPIRTENPMNSGNYVNPFVQAKKRKNERARVGKYLLPVKLPKTYRVTITRVSVNEMDHAGLLASLKSVQDAIANRMGVDDKPSGVVEWVFAQEKGKRGDPMVRVEFEVLP